MAFQIDLNDLERINIVGTSACGKSTLGKQLAVLLDIPYIEMDQLYHGPSWAEPERDAFRAKLADAIAGPKWVLDGNYHSKTFDIKWQRTTLIIWVDISFSVNLWRAVRRAVQRSWTQQEIWPGTGNRESFRQTFFSKDSMILWTAISHGRLRKRYSHIASNPPEDIKFIRLRNSKDVAQFCEHVRCLV